MEGDMSDLDLWATANRYATILKSEQMASGTIRLEMVHGQYCVYHDPERELGVVVSESDTFSSTSAKSLFLGPLREAIAFVEGYLSQAEN